MLWHCWLGHLARKIVSEMTYNVSSGTLNPTILYFFLYLFNQSIDTVRLFKINIIKMELSLNFSSGIILGRGAMLAVPSTVIMTKLPEIGLMKFGT